MVPPSRRRKSVRARRQASSNEPNQAASIADVVESSIEKPAIKPSQAILAGVWGMLTIAWSVVLLQQEFFAEVPRWALFLVPGQMVAAWADGPVTITGLVDRIRVLLIAATLLGFAGCAGYLLVRGTFLCHVEKRVERWVMMVLLGLILHSSSTLILGLVHALAWRFSIVLVALMSCGVASGLNHFMRRIGNSEEPASDQVTEEPSDRGDRRGSFVAKCFAVAMGVVLVGHSLLPPSEYDVREYHLQAPKEWFQEGTIAFMPHNIYANMPLGAEMHVLCGMMSWNAVSGDAEAAWWWGALVGKVVLAWFVIANAFVVRAGSRLLLQRVGQAAHANWISDWCMVIALTTPALLEGGALGLVEPALAAYVALGLLLVMLVFTASDAKQTTACTVMLALTAGATMSIKYPAVVLIIPFMLVAAAYALIQNEHRRQFVRPAVWLAAGLAMGIGGAAWYVKNICLAGNPVYPLVGQWLGGSTLTPEKIAQWNEAHEVPGYSLHQLYLSLSNGLWGWRLQSWTLLPLFCVGLFAVPRCRVARIIAAGLCFYCLGWWLLTHRIERFLIPILPMAMWLAAAGMSRLLEAMDRRWLGAAIGCLVFLDAAYGMRATMGDSRIFVDLQTLRRDDLSTSSISRLPQHVPYVNQELPVDAKLLIVGDAAVFDFDRPLDYSTTFDRSPLMNLLGENAEETVDRFRSAGYSHVLVHWGEIERLRTTYGFDERINRELFTQLQQIGVLSPQPTVLLDGRVEIYPVLSSQSGSLSEPELP